MENRLAWSQKRREARILFPLLVPVAELLTEEQIGSMYPQRKYLEGNWKWGTPCGEMWGSVCRNVHTFPCIRATREP